MALNKSIKHTPASRNGYLSELTASSGNKTNFLLPVRIKVTPTHTCPLSDGKKNPSRMLQPVLIKDLLSSHKDRNSSTLTSVSTQKKKARPKRLMQPYLNTQSCRKPKNENDEDLFLLSRKSYGESKVRRQLYQTLDSPQNFGLENKENSSKTAKPKKVKICSNEESESRSAQAKNKNRQSFLLPPNSIKNSFINKTGTKSKVLTRESGKSTITNVNRQTNGPLRVMDTRKSQAVARKSILSKVEQNEVVESAYSTPDSGDKQQSLYTTRDKYTMTSPLFNRCTFLSKSTSDLRKFEIRPSVIMSPSKRKSELNNRNSIELPYSKMQNLSNIKELQSCPQNDQIHIQRFQKTEFEFSGINKLDAKSMIQFKSFLEQSIETCEAQVSNLKQVLSFVNTMLSSSNTEPCMKSNESFNDTEKSNISSKFNVYYDKSDTTEIVEKSIKMNNLTFEAELLGAEVSHVKPSDLAEKIPKEKLPLPIKILVNEVDKKQEAKMSPVNLSDLARLSTIGEVSCEGDELHKYEYENKENQCNLHITPTTPKTPKQLVRRSYCDSSNRRRSARLAAKRLSISESDNHDSFTMLENELNVEHPTSSKSLPASPMKAPMASWNIRQWDKKVERPLKEYMALKMNGTFLVTPDVKRFQSCLDLEPTDTPHSRKSLSRKIFMELCDLYGESPEK
ncbi:uncharacterized protein LOC131668152 [Phymastichus coffea]|uniref:uncharacterized protein LOC131668152 n=1 Tax=Phymastichus coffea TaxID=108790 RepID=UPI00273B9FB9|nr:uncharacterized protein LOC131668152 [Phymastichus coffea]